MSDLHDDDDDGVLWEDDLLEEPEPIEYEPEGPVTEDEEIEDISGLLTDPSPVHDPRYDEALIGDDGDDFEDLGLLNEDEDEDLRWLQEEPPPEIEATPAPPRPAWRVPHTERPPRPLKPLTVGYRLKVGLPDFEVEGLPGRCMVHRAWSSLRIPIRGESLGARVRLSFGDKDLSLPVVQEEEEPAVRLRLIVAGRDVQATLRLAHSDGPVRVLLGRDVLAAAALVIDVREDAS